MSIGNAPSALGTLLVQRLDAVLGTTLSQQANLASGARPDAVSQPGQPDRGEPTRNDTLRHPQESLNRSAGQIEQHRKQIALGRADQNPAALLRGMGQTPQSSQINLGATARIILDLLNHYPGHTPVQAKHPLLAQRPIPGTPAGPGQQTPSSNARTQSAGGPQQTATQAPQARADASAPLASNPQAASTQAGTTSTTAGIPLPASHAQTTTGAAPDARTSLLTQPQVASLPGALPSSTATAGLFAQALFQAVQGSGIFYESHLGQLAFGQRTAAQLQAEPQAQLGSNAEQARQSSTGTPSSTAANPSSSNPASQSTAQASHAPVPGTDVAMVVRQQLEVLANQAFSWRGEAWPNADMQWDIQRRHAGQDEPGGEQDYWATRLTLHLPTLGQVNARLTLSGQHVIMRVEAPDSAELLSSNAAALQGRFSALGLQLGQLHIAAQDSEAALQEPAHAEPLATR